MRRADRALRFGDGIGLLAEFGCVGAEQVGMRRFDFGEPLGDLGGDGLGDTHVVEDVFVGWYSGVAQ